MHLLSTNFDSYIRANSAQKYNISGFDSPAALAFLLINSAVSKLRTNLIVVDSDKVAEELKNSLLFYDSTCKVSYLPHFQTQMYSEVIPSNQLTHARVEWLYHAQNTNNFSNHFFIASLSSLLQKTLPLQIFYDHSFNLTVNSDLPTNITQRLIRLGYRQSPLIEDPGSFAMRGGIFDIYSSAHEFPIRAELFGDQIESLKFFNPKTQRSLDSTNELTILPAKEAIYSDENRQNISRAIKASAHERNINEAHIKEFLQDIATWKYFYGSDYFINYFYEQLESPFNYFSQPINIWSLNNQSQVQKYDKFISELKEHSKYSEGHSALLPEHNKIFIPLSEKQTAEGSVNLNISQIHFADIDEQTDHNSTLEYPCNSLSEFKKSCLTKINESSDFLSKFIIDKFSLWKEQEISIFIANQSEKDLRRLEFLLEGSSFKLNNISDANSTTLFEDELQAQQSDSNIISIVPRSLPESVFLKNERIIFLRLVDILGKKSGSSRSKKTKDFKKAQALHFADLKPEDHIVHKEHGVGIYKGLTLMPIAGIDSEFLKLEYKGGDVLYLPIYRIGQIQKFTGAGQGRVIDKLGGQSWKKAKTKVKNKLKDIAGELLKLYAERAEITRPSFPAPSSEFNKFVDFFPFTETNDQLNAINHVLNDMTNEKPMDRLICGDVGFGKTEVAMRAAFNCALDGRQVAIIAPTTILTFQHFENFKKRFSHWPFKICCLNRFVPRAEIKKNIELIKEGKVDIVIGTHRLFSKDVVFKNLGLLIIDEEQKFGVKHKEKIRSIKTHVDTLTLSATPIPRTLNMSFLGLRDLSLINTPPVDRLPTRTFICKYEQHTITKAIQNEVDRGGQVFFLHNRVNNIETMAQELRELLPNVRFAIGHGQMNETELEKVMVSFFNKEVDVLISTTIIESGMDIPNANTIIINNAQNLGLSQLYQLRGRVGRSTQRAYCYLLVPQNKLLDKHALERLKVIQQNSELGSGITIAQYDLELRGSGDLLGENQSGHVNTVGYDLYMDLLKKAINEQKQNPDIINRIEPEINLRIPALIPDKYISDIRLRLSYYKSLSDIESIDEIDDIEEELRDQFGKLPEPVLNLLGIMIIRFLCKKLYIKDLSQAKNGITLIFLPETALKTEQVLKLSARADNKYQLTPDGRLLVKIKEKSWERIYEEISYLAKTANLI